MQLLSQEIALVNAMYHSISTRKTWRHTDCAPLHACAFLGLRTIMGNLLDAGAAVDLLDLKGNSALHFSAVSGHSEIVELLLAAGAKVDRQNVFGETPLELAVVKGHMSIIQLLTDIKAQMDRQNRWCYRALEEAAALSVNAERVVRLLLDKGAAVKWIGASTALYFRNNVYFARLLIKKRRWRQCRR